MALLQKKVLTIENDHNLNNILIDLNHDTSILKQNVQTNLYNLLIKYKSNIDNNPHWNKIKKLSNLYEYIYVYNKHINNNIGTALYNPLSRSFFKLQEMIIDLDILDNDTKKLTILGLAEAPGGFMECLYEFRKKHTINNNDDYYCISLISNNSDIPSLFGLKKIIKNNKLTILKGEDETGNLYNYKNVIHIKNSIQKKVDIVTADGGFNYDDQYNFQEQLSYKLIYSEIITALHTLKNGGHFILKIFDIFTHNTFHLIYFVSKFFKKVHIIKPFSSRPANSEKYLVCKSFTGLNKYYSKVLLDTLLDWNVINDNLKYVTNIFTITPNYNYNIIMESIEKYNIMFVKNQIKNILTTLSYIQYNLSEKDKELLHYKQASMSFFWCLKYKLNLNYKCKYLK